MAAREPRVKEITRAHVASLRDSLDRLVKQSQSIDDLMGSGGIEGPLFIDGGAKAFEALEHLTKFLHAVHSACDMQMLPKFGESEAVQINPKPKARPHKK